jgi:hypothetical protein
MKSAFLISILLTIRPTPSEQSFVGTWDTSYGTMVLTAAESRISGFYTLQGQRCTIDGKLDGKRFVFQYSEPNAKGEGWFELSAGRDAWTGKWREAGGDIWQDWIGRRLREVSAKETGFAGLWDSSFGRIRIGKFDDELRGTYNYGPGGSISGKQEGNRFTFTYREPNIEGEGWFELAEDGRSFAGKWRAKGSERWQNWRGTRVIPVSGRVWLVVIEAPWEGSLADQEYSFGQMLRAFFSRTPNVQVRHRIFTDEASMRRWLGEIAYLAEPVVISLASHGSAKGVNVGGQTIGYEAIAEGLRFADNVKLLHFSACDMMKDRLPEQLRDSMNGHARFPISGYTRSVDWAASAILEFGYFDLILSRGMSPEAASGQIERLMPFAGTKRVPGAPFQSAGFRIVLPEAARAKAG